MKKFLRNFLIFANFGISCFGDSLTACYMSCVSAQFDVVLAKFCRLETVACKYFETFCQNISKEETEDFSQKLDRAASFLWKDFSADSEMNFVDFLALCCHDIKLELAVNIYKLCREKLSKLERCTFMGFCMPHSDSWVCKIISFTEFSRGYFMEFNHRMTRNFLMKCVECKTQISILTFTIYSLYGIQLWFVCLLVVCIQRIFLGKTSSSMRFH